AAARLDVSSGELEVKFGIVRVRADMTKSASYAELIGDQEFHLKLDKNAPLKKPAEYTVVGKSLPRPDVPAKVTGEHTYMHDFRVPGMLHARVVRPPALGAQLTGVDESSIGSIKGLMRVVRLGNFLAVVAETEWAAIKAAERLKSSWSAWEGLPEMDKLYQVVRATPVAKDEITVNVGDPKLALASAAKTLAATYEFALHTHGSIGPSCAVADVRDGSATIWSASQAPHWLRRGLGAGGSIVAWQSEFRIPKLSAITDGVPLIAATLAGLPRKDAINPGNIFQNSAPSYPFPNAHALVHRLETTPFRPSWIRTPGRMQNTYANEAFMDELAAAAGADPVEFRLRHLKDPRGVEVLKAAATAAKWETRASPRKAAAKAAIAAGRGVTYVKYENVRTYVAAVAEVVVERRSGAIRVMRVVVAHDCGLVINPDGVRAQIEGNVI